MKIERDKVHLTRCGGKVRVVCLDRPNEHFPIVGVDERGMLPTYRTDGAYEPDGRPSPDDLVSEYVEPPKPREVWVEVSNPKRAGTAWFDHEKARLADNDLAAKLVKFREVLE